MPVGVLVVVPGVGPGTYDVSSCTVTWTNVKLPEEIVVVPGDGPGVNEVDNGVVI